MQEGPGGAALLALLRQFAFCRYVTAELFGLIDCTTGSGRSAKVLALKHESRILGLWSNPVSGARKSQASSPVRQTAQSLTCSIMEKPQTGLNACPRILGSCFRARNSGERCVCVQIQVQLNSQGRRKLEKEDFCRIIHGRRSGF